ncbi:stage V sporulation protein S [Flammeovirga agarivorans]|uniref:stage V sporulation protein S n=1 Tax=Flammeovirga agarivorans TaxID=2726742 RepID=UPI003744A7F6
MIKVSTQTNVQRLAKSIEQGLRQQESVNLVSVGAGALNQKIKAVIEASGRFYTKGVKLSYNHSFTNVSDGKVAISTKVLKERIGLIQATSAL